MFRVEGIANDLQITVDLRHLHKAVDELHHASLQLDKEKKDAEKNLWRIIRRWQRRHRKHRGNNNEENDVAEAPTAADNESENDERGFKSPWRRLRCFVKNLLGFRRYGYNTSDEPDEDQEQQNTNTQANKPRHRVPRRLRRAIKRVQNVNKILSTFEAGFISEDGIKDREWYRHLGVAPGKWLG